MIAVTIHIPISEVRDGGRAYGPLPASIQPDGYTVEAQYAGWGRNRDGSVSVDVSASVRSPAGLTGVLR